MSSRVYVVNDGKSEFLVRATSASQAVRSIADPIFTVKVASQDDLIRLAKTHPVKES